jgi:hypothetical protein
MMVGFDFDFADACICTDDATWRNCCDAKAVEAVMYIAIWLQEECRCGCEGDPARICRTNELSFTAILNKVSKFAFIK